MQTPLDRLLEAAECRSQIELANLLGTRQSLISDAKRRGIIPVDWLAFLQRTKGVRPEWILSGTAPKYECAEK
ncbi:helix-turn-helix domain-containing protein [uncultured Desulfovibrio sp.]|uniref:helix-turn-helix domain-containing protein n=1 Tax=uncultured Desulfovibrio sp. TaxID=167968 RepID=UPI002605C73F|nr:helix-turn-helix domain-containing protein [uncultured Desulfovibrio sp.]